MHEIKMSYWRLSVRNGENIILTAEKKQRAPKNAGEGINGMAVFYLVRHGEADYDHMLEKGFWGFGRDFAPLSPKGRQQAETAARDGRLKSAEIIVSFPYTRALQTAQIISTETGTIYIPRRRKALHLPGNSRNGRASIRRA